MKVKEIKFLAGKRFDDEANLVYKVPVKELPKIKMLNQKNGKIEEYIDFKHKDTWKMIVEFIRHHREKQVPRLQELNRYMLVENNILYRSGKPEGRSDNRIPSDFANFIVSFKLGVLLGNPLRYKGDKIIAKRINDFADRSNEDYHNQLMGRDMFALGRAYEWIGRDEFGKETLAKFDAEQTFVIYDNTKNKNSICGVHYYREKLLDKNWTCVELYTNSGFNFFIRVEDDALDEVKIEDIEESYFDTVQINEWINNEERMSDFERVLGQIDAYDLSRSEMANFQQDTSEGYLVLKGNPEIEDDDKDLETKSSKLELFQAMAKARMLVLGDKREYDKGMGAEPDAYFLKKEYDVAGIEANDSRIVADILRFTSLIDFTDENIGSNQSGIGFRFKGWGSDNDRKNKERMVKKAIMRRLRLLTHSWSIKDDLNESRSLVENIKAFFVFDEKQQEQLYNKVNDIQILFTPNVPQSDEEIMNVIRGMASVVSDQTLCEMAERLTGVPFEEELNRLNKDRPDEPVLDYEFGQKTHNVDKQQDSESTKE